MAELGTSRDVDIVCLTLQELVEFGHKLIQLSESEERTILGRRISEMFDNLLFPYLSPRRTSLRISRLTEEQNAWWDGGQGGLRGLLEGLESLYDRVANTIVESEVFVALVWLRADLEEKV